MLQRGYLIGGAPLAGKTYWAQAMVAGHEGAVSVGTDRVCAAALRRARPDVQPNLFYAHGHDVESFYRMYDTPEKAVAAAVLQASELEEAVRLAFQRRTRRHRLMILEGVALTPSLSKRLEREFEHVALQSFVFYDDDASRILERIRTRGLWRTAGAYPGHVADKELAYVLAFNDWFRREAQAHGCLLVHIDTLPSIRFP